MDSIEFTWLGVRSLDEVSEFFFQHVLDVISKLLAYLFTHSWYIDTPYYVYCEAWWMFC